MKRTLSLLTASAVTALFFAFPAVSAANDLSIFGGSPIPHGNTEGGLYGQKAGGWEIGAGYTIPLRVAMFLRLEADYCQLPNNVTFAGLSPMKIIEVSANLKVVTCNKHKFKPYLLMGLGVAEINVLVDHGVDHVTFSSTEITGRLGAGVDWDVAKRWGVFVEGMFWESYYYSVIPVRAGVRLKL